VREHLIWWATTKTFFQADYEGEKMFSQIAQFFLSVKIFPECPKCLGINENFLHHL
jgi:hypothetical protein